MKEDCKEYFNNIIKNYEKNVELTYVKKTNKLKNIIKKFIIENKLILYGGSAIDILLPTDKKIYNKTETLFDYDVYSCNAYEYGIKLVQLLTKHKYKYVQLREAAFTQNTFKIFIENLPIFDITNLPIETFELYNNYSKKKQQMLVIGPEIIIRDMCAQLSQPHISYFRLEKTYERYNIFESVYGINNYSKDINLIEPNDEELEILNILLKECKKEGYPILGYYGLQLLNDKNTFYSIDGKNSYLSFFSKDLEKIIKKLKKYNITIEKNTNFTTLQYNYKNICDIYDSSQLCVSYCSKKGFNILTIFGIKYFMYNNLVSFIDSIRSYIEQYMIYNVNKYIKNNDCKKNCKITMQCYGDGKPPGWQIIKSRWDNGIVKYKPPINSKLDTFFNK